MYPVFLAEANEDSDAKQHFHWADEVEIIHKGLFQKAIR